VAVTKATEIAQEIHKLYVEHAPSYDVEVITWDELEEYQRQLAVAVVASALARGVITDESKLGADDA